MKQGLILMTVTLILFLLGHSAWGYWTVYHLAYGAISLMALMIAGTFLWLYLARATPLALGMAFSWLGTGGVMGWWWMYHYVGSPTLMQANPALFVFLAFYVTGAILHFAVIQLSFARSWTFGWIPVAVALLVSAALTVSS